MQVICLPLGYYGSDSFRSMEIGNRIASARTQAKLTQTELANAIGVTRGLVGQWESHRKKPGRDNLYKIAKATLVNVEWLLTGNDDYSVTVSDPEALSMLRAFMRMSPRARKNAVELFGVSADVGREIEQQSRPAKPKVSA